MDYKKELQRVEGMIKKGRTKQAAFILFFGLFFGFGMSSSAVPSIRELIIAMIIGIAGVAFISWGSIFVFSDFDEIVYDENAQRPRTLTRIFRRNFKYGRQVYNELKEYREELLIRVGDELHQTEQGTNSVVRGSMSDF